MSVQNEAGYSSGNKPKKNLHNYDGNTDTHESKGRRDKRKENIFTGYIVTVILLSCNKTNLRL